MRDFLPNLKDPCWLYTYSYLAGWLATMGLETETIWAVEYYAAAVILCLLGGVTWSNIGAELDKARLKA